MGLFKWLKGKMVKEEIIFEGENLYEKIKTQEINDYNKMFGTNYDTSSDKFQNYYNLL